MVERRLCGRKETVANSRLLKIHWFARNESFVDFAFAAIAVLEICDLAAPLQPLAAKD